MERQERVRRGRLDKLKCCFVILARQISHLPNKPPCFTMGGPGKYLSIVTTVHRNQATPMTCTPNFALLSKMNQRLIIRAQLPIVRWAIAYTSSASYSCFNQRITTTAPACDHRIRRRHLRDPVCSFVAVGGVLPSLPGWFNISTRVLPHAAMQAMQLL